MFPYISNIPYVSKSEMVEIDRLMIEEFYIRLIQMMENAGRNLAYLTNGLFLSNNPVKKNILVLAGAGGNGGGTLVAARRLHNWGANIYIITTKPFEEFSEIPEHQFKILKKLDVTFLPDTGSISKISHYDVIIDGIIGYSIDGNPRGTAKNLIESMKQIDSKVISLDIPSGIDPDAGPIYEPYVRADATMTLVLPKKAFKNENMKDILGDLYLADISVPDEIYQNFFPNISRYNIFSKGEILRLD